MTLQQPIADEKPWTGKPVFSIVDVQVNDGKAFGEYVVGHSATVAEAGGKFLAAGARGESIEGTRKPRNIVIHQWPNAQTFLIGTTVPPIHNGNPSDMPLLARMSY